MSIPVEDVTVELLRSWRLPDPGESKKARGRVVVIGGSRRSPGAVLLSAEAALRVGAGRLTVMAPRTIDVHLAIALPEAAVLTLPDDSGDALGDSLAEEIANADAVLVGPGFDDPAETARTVLAVARVGASCVVLDAFALGILPDLDRDDLPHDLVLNPNREEAEILLRRPMSTDAEARVADVQEISDRFGAVVNCYGMVAAPGQPVRRIHAGGAGLGTSGSGDVLAGCITGFAARGTTAADAAVWGSWTHARAGDRLTQRLGLGFLARDLPPELTRALAEADGG